jgi:uncharacterized membrane protein YhiD involved in acid resistance
MPSDPNTINYLLSGALAAIISGFILLVNNLVNNHLNNKSQSEREEKQRIWQLEREEQQRIWQEESEQKKWYREKVYDSYRASIQVLTKIIQMEIEMKKSSTIPEDKYTILSNLRIEFGSEFSIVITGHPDKESKEFIESINKIFEETFEKYNPWIARDIINEIMENDSRIKNINK